jgi:hypothetical protein
MAVVMPTYEAGKPVGQKTLYAGAVLMTREKNYYDDSDFYAVVWDADEKKLANYEYGSTRYGGSGGASEDATPEVVAAANAYAYQALKKVAFAAYVDGLKTPEKGDTVTVVRDKNGKGSTGFLFWVGEERTYGGYSKWSQKTVQKCGVALDTEKNEKGQFKNVVWTYLANLDVDVSKKFSYKEAKYRLKSLKRAGWAAWSSYMAYPLAYFH